jgi:hypothetical protein
VLQCISPGPGFQVLTMPEQMPLPRIFFGAKGKAIVSEVFDHHLGVYQGSDASSRLLLQAATPPFFFFALAFFRLLSRGFSAVMPDLHTSAYRA